VPSCIIESTSLKAHLHVLFWYGHETCCQIPPKFFYGCKMITSEPNSESLEGSDAAHSKIKRIKWLGSGWNLNHQKRMHCEGGDRVQWHGEGSNCFSLFQSLPMNDIPHMFQKCNTKHTIHYLSYRDTLWCTTPTLSKAINMTLC
jgi:hypothetical protein